MTLDELRNRLLVSRSRSVCINLETAVAFPGFVRSITIRPSYQVAIEFNSHGHDEGGACFIGEFATLEEAVASIEEYLGTSLPEWDSQHDYPQLPLTANATLGEERLASAIAAGTVPLPTKGQFRLQDSYWSTFLPR